MRLLIFNPETEYALASGASFYTPPARIEALRRELQLLPEAWALPDDIILVDDPKALRSRFSLASWSDLGKLFEMHPKIVIEPWGWNPALVRRLQDAGVPTDNLPDKETIARIRQLAHRRTTITLNALWNDCMACRSSALPLHEDGRLLPVELTSIEECMDYYQATTGCWMKAPWSSSGRGVINTGADMTAILVEQWCRGILRRQGSVIGETPADRIADFASEWMIERNGEVRFLGLSSFSTSPRGKYISNESIPQSEIRCRFDSLSKIPIDEVISIQKEILSKVLVGYRGPCGVDMLIERSGNLRPFVELNLRQTMGMLHLGI